MSEKFFNVKSDGDKFLVKVYYMGGYARVWAYLDEGLAFSDMHFLTLQKDWEGFIIIDVPHFEYGMDAVDSAELISIAIRAGAYICDQMMAVGYVEDGFNYDNLDEALASLNCFDGADKNPGIVWEEVKLDD